MIRGIWKVIKKVLTRPTIKKDAHAYQAEKVNPKGHPRWWTRPRKHRAGKWKARREARALMQKESRRKNRAA